MISSTQTHHPLVADTAERESAQKAAAVEQFMSRMRSAGLRHTQPRLAIFKALQSFSEPVSIESIFQNIRSKSCDLVTVYRTLALFEELGIVQRCFSNTGTSLYEIKREGDPVHYVICRKTGARLPLEAQMNTELNQVLQRVYQHLAERGLKAIHSKVEFYALSNKERDNDCTQALLNSMKNLRVQAPISYR